MWIVPACFIGYHLILEIEWPDLQSLLAGTFILMGIFIYTCIMNSLLDSDIPKGPYGSEDHE